MHEVLRLDNQLCFALYAASKAVTQAYQPLLAELGITYPQYLALLVLWEKDHLLVKEIGDRLELDSGTLTPLLKRLENQGLVVRERQQDDQRQVRIRLSPAGRSLENKALSIPKQLACRYGKSPAAVHEASQLREVLNNLRQRLRNEA
jgi:MarR family transcriptional regulator, organic hydroperoxide resistance regulator